MKKLAVFVIVFLVSSVLLQAKVDVSNVPGYQVAESTLKKLSPDIRKTVESLYQQVWDQIEALATNFKLLTQAKQKNKQMVIQILEADQQKHQKKLNDLKNKIRSYGIDLKELGLWGI